MIRRWPCIVVVTLYCLLAVAASSHPKTGIWLPCTFSSLRFGAEAGDLRGVELKIVPTRKGFREPCRSPKLARARSW